MRLAAFLIVIPTLLILIGWVAWKIKKAPRGYQKDDDMRFHYGEDK